jgi:hypothetical protein
VRRKLTLNAMHETYFPRSKALRSAAYDEETQELTIRLTTDRTYVYRRVPDWVYEKLITAESAGRYYNLKIRDGYQYFEVLPPERRPVRPQRSRPKRGSAPRKIPPESNPDRRSRGAKRPTTLTQRAERRSRR